MLFNIPVLNNHLMHHYYLHESNTKSTIMKYPAIITAVLTATTLSLSAQEKMKPEETEVWGPLPKVVTLATATSAPSDAIVLFDGKNLDQWVQADDKSPAKWTVANNQLSLISSMAILKPNDLLAIISCI